MRSLVLAAALLALATPSAAVPPPPPNPAALDALSSYVTGMRTHDLGQYASALADGVVVDLDGRRLANAKADWLPKAIALLAGADHDVFAERVYVGADYVADGPSAPFKALVFERVNRVLGDCCIYERTELLTFRDGRITRIERSPEFSLLYKPIAGSHGDPLPGGR